MKKLLMSLIFFSCVILYISGFNVVSAETKAIITVSKVTAGDSDVVEVPISISGNPGICGAAIRISYDRSLSLTGIKQGNALSSLILTKPGEISANPINVLWDGIDADGTNGIIAVLTFNKPENAGTYNISASYESGDIIDGDLNPIELSMESGSIVVPNNTGEIEPTSTPFVPTSTPTSTPEVSVETTSTPTPVVTQKPSKTPVNVIELDNGNFWDSLLSFITFGMYKPDTTVTITSSLENDAEIYYYIDNTGKNEAFTKEELEKIGTWNKYQGKFVLTNSKNVVYAKIIDKNSKITYFICSDGIEIKSENTVRPTAKPTPTPTKKPEENSTSSPTVYPSPNSTVMPTKEPNSEQIVNPTKAPDSEHVPEQIKESTVVSTNAPITAATSVPNDNVIYDDVLSIDLEASKLTLYTGIKRTIKASVDSNIYDVDDIIWSSSNIKVATVKGGIVTPHKAGKVKIYARIDDVVEKIDVTVKQSGIVIKNNEQKTVKAVTLKLKSKKTKVLTVNVVPGSSDIKITGVGTKTNKIAEIKLLNKGKTLKIKGKKSGHFTITIKSGKFSKKLKITVK